MEVITKIQDKKFWSTWCRNVGNVGTSGGLLWAR